MTVTYARYLRVSAACRAVAAKLERKLVIEGDLPDDVRAIIQDEVNRLRAEIDVIDMIARAKASLADGDFQRKEDR